MTKGETNKCTFKEDRKTKHKNQFNSSKPFTLNMTSLFIMPLKT